MKPIFFFRLFIYLIAIFLLLGNKSVSQLKTSEKQYHILFNKLNSDSLYIYEVYSGWGEGVKYFISFRKGETRTGYCLTSQFIKNLLIPRSLLPENDSITDQIVFTDSAVVERNIHKCHFNQVKSFSEEINCQAKSPDVDGRYFSFAYLSKSNSWIKTYYEIYYYLKQCPNEKIFIEFSRIDKFFKTYFPTTEEISKSIIQEYKKQKGIPQKQ